jgi:hypothetical protein
MSAARPDRIPFATKSRPAAQSLERVILAYALKTMSPGSEESLADIARDRWPDDTTTVRLLTRGATSPASRTGGWASAVAPNLVSDFVASLSPISAAARLMGAGMSIDLSGMNSINVPRRQNGAKPATSVPWIAEGAPIPVKQYTLNAATLGPAYKLASISALTREAVVHSSGQQTISTLLREDVSASLDAWVFSTQAGTVGTSPPGLLAGLSPLTATTGGGDDAMLTDLERLAGVIADSGGSNVVFIAASRQAFAARLRLLSDQFVIWPSAFLASGTVIAVEPSAFVSYVSPEPDIDVAIDAALTFEDTSPQPIAQGTGPTVATPVYSIYQQDLVAIRVLLEVSYTMRANGMVSYLTGATWGAAS